MDFDVHSEIDTSNKVGHFVLDEELSIEEFHEALSDALTFLVSHVGGSIGEVALVHAGLRGEKGSREVGFGAFHS